MHRAILRCINNAEEVMPRIAILVPHLNHADAVGNDVVAMRDILRAQGHEVRIFAGGSSTCEKEVIPDDKIFDYLAGKKDILIYHFATGWDRGLEIVKKARCIRIIKYHNVTPPNFFEGIDSIAVRDCRKGRQMIQDFARFNCDLYIADSEYNKQELVDAGADKARCFVLSPIHQIDRLLSIQPDQGVLKTWGDGLVNILMVGRVAPNKGHLSLIEAFSLYHHHYNLNSRLIIVGRENPSLSIYSRMLRDKVSECALHNAVAFVGGVSDQALRAYYQLASVFVITSEHEGFCVPLVEAMCMRVPIVALSTSAVPETIGKGGVVWEENNPALFASSIDFIVREPSIHQSLGHLGWQRYANAFSTSRLKEKFLDILSHSALACAD
jgi:glycosyltransferase involved in cell wall biosynthesis